MHKRESQNDEKCIINEGKYFNVVENEKRIKIKSCSLVENMTEKEVKKLV